RRVRVRRVASLPAVGKSVLNPKILGTSVPLDLALSPVPIRRSRANFLTIKANYYKLIKSTFTAKYNRKEVRYEKAC
ncbi:MAG: hypothetical protein AAB404_02280, partial [Patescibacteria group bacterium]